MDKRRFERYFKISKKLKSMKDDQLIALIKSSDFVHSGVGGSSCTGVLEDSKVFIKKVPVTRLELEPENKLSTKNYFNLPMFFQYGVGSPGFGVWRELVCHEMTTDWVLSEEVACFPLMYHWRILPNTPEKMSDEKRKLLDEKINYWEGSESVRNRFESIACAPSYAAVFLEHFPQDLSTWLSRQYSLNRDKFFSSLLFLEKELNDVNNFLETKKMIHFDAHFRNILTDCNSLYLTDFGLTHSLEFELSDSELEFFYLHKKYDYAMTSIGIIHSFLSTLNKTESNNIDFEGLMHSTRKTLVGAVADLFDRHAATALVMADFFKKLRFETKRTPYSAQLRNSEKNLT